MLQSECKIGMRVVFGRANGEKTTGRVVKMNRMKAKVQTDEARGSRSPAGTIWGVPYSMLREIGGTADIPAATLGKVLMPVQVKDIPYNPFDVTGNSILTAIDSVYSQLSPENLTCDGELPQYMVVAKAAKLRKQLAALQTAYGSPVSETEVYKWYESKSAYEKKELQNA